MPITKRKGCDFHVRFSSSESERIHHHSDRLGIDNIDMTRLGMHELLNKFDDQEAAERAQRNARTKTKAPKMGGLPGGVEATGITFKRTDPAPTEAPTPDEKIPKKLTDSFARFFREVDGAVNAQERSVRINDVLSDLLGRAPSDQIANIVFMQFLEQLKSREATKPVKFEKIPEDVVIDGGDDA